MFQGRSGLAAFFLCLCGIAVAAQPREMTSEDIAAWREIQDGRLSADGAWLAYLLAPDAGSTQREATVVLRSTQGKTERRYAAGDPKRGAGQLQMSGDGRWIAFIRALATPKRPAKAAPEKAQSAPSGKDKSATGEGQQKGKSDEPRNAAVLVEVASGRETVIENIQRFAFGGRDGEWIVLYGYGAENAGAPALLQRLGAGPALPLGEVDQFAFDEAGTKLAWSSKSADGTGNALQLRQLDSGVTRVLDAQARAVYQKLSWSEDGRALAALRELKPEDSKPEGKSAESKFGESKSGESKSDQSKGKSESKPPPERALLAFTAMDTGAPQRHQFLAAGWSGFPAGHEFDPEGDLAWREDAKGLFFRVRPVPKAISDDVPEQLRLWHWKAELNPWQKKHQKPERGFLAFVSLEQGRYVALGDADFKAEPHPRGQYVLGYHDGGPEGRLQAAHTGRQPADYSLVDVATGQRTLVVQGLQRIFAFSFDAVLAPDGGTVLYYNIGDGHYYAYDVPSKRTRKLTEGLPPFWDTYRERNIAHGMNYDVAKLAGWSKDGRYVILNDHFDLWALPRRPDDVAAPIRLTPDGREKRITYTWLDLENRQRWFRNWVQAEPKDMQRWIDLDRPLYLHGVAYLSQDSGFFVREPGTGSALRQLIWGEFTYSDLVKARDTDVVVYLRQNALTSPDYWTSGLGFAAPRRVTDVNPLQRELRWMSGARMLNYRNDQGEMRRAALWLPAGYEKGKAYPTIVNIYEEVAEGYPLYRAPSLQGDVNPNIAEYTQKGYAVLRPDIVPKANEFGASAVRDVLAGVEAAVATGVVDRDRLGLTGQSYGGLETAFIITQTDIFKAAVAVDLDSDLLTAALQTYGYYDGPPASVFGALAQTNQFYMTRAPWDDPDTYIRNSALHYAKNVKTPLLIRQNDRDHATPFFQGVQYFNLLRGLGKPVVMLQYEGADHATNAERPEDEIDFARRRLEFFDHFLKDAPEPAWWTAGTP